MLHASDINPRICVLNVQYRRDKTIIQYSLTLDFKLTDCLGTFVKIKLNSRRTYAWQLAFKVSTFVSAGRRSFSMTLVFFKV